MRKVILGAFVGLTIGAGAAFAEDAAPNGIATLDDYVAGLVTIDVTINGETMPFLFDTGGGATLVTPEFAAESGLDALVRGRHACTSWAAASSFRP